MKKFIRVMKALSDPNRVRVLKLLQQQELCVCEIQALLGLAQSTVSKHMKILEDAGLVDRQRQGSWIIYNAADDTGPAFAGTMLKEITGLFEHDAELKKMLKQLPEIAELRNSCPD